MSRSQLARRAKRPSPRLGTCNSSEPPPQCRSECQRRRAKRGASGAHLSGNWGSELLKIPRGHGHCLPEG
eukprot:15431054-Alexandrium_andersonii.AAC.1